MRHASLPAKLTVEALATWITENQQGLRTYEEKIPLTPEEIQAHEHDIAVATAAVIELKSIEKNFKSILKKGTSTLDQPDEITIPPTKGLDALNNKIEFHDTILKAGYNLNITDLYYIPWPEKKTMLCVDIEGQEYPDFNKKMSGEEQKAHTTLFE